MCSTSVSCVRAHCRSAKSSAIVGGNFGAPPKPPNRGSNCTRSVAIARVNNSSSIVPDTRVRSLLAAYSSRIEAVVRATLSRRFCHASATPERTRRKLGIPWRSSGGKYVPA